MKRVGIGLVFALLLVLVGAYTGRLREQAMGHYLSTQRYEDVYYLPPPAWLRLFSLGYREALADLIWMKALIYFGEELYHRGEVKNLYAYTDAILALDEHFVAVYHWVASCALYRTGEITVDDARRAIAYLERGVRLFPDDGTLAWDLGATYRFELVPLLIDREARDEARRRGVEHLQTAALRGAGPPWLVFTNATQLEKLGQTEQAIHHLEEAYQSIFDPQLRQDIESRLRALRSTAHAEALRHAVVDFEQERQKHFPYLSGILYWLVGARPPFDGYQQLQHYFDPLLDRFDEAKELE